MEIRNEETHLTPREASGGSKNGHVRYILVISMALVIIAFLAVWAIEHATW